VEKPFTATAIIIAMAAGWSIFNAFLESILLEKRMKRITKLLRTALKRVSARSRRKLQSDYPDLGELFDNLDIV